MKIYSLSNLFIALTIVIGLFSNGVPETKAQTFYTTGFEPATFSPGNINGQNGWGYFPNSPTKGVIETTPAGSPVSFGTQSLAVRTNDVGFFGVANNLYSATIDPAGETGSTIGGVVVAAPYNRYVASFYYRTPSAAAEISTRADGRFAELNPSSKGTAANDYPNRYAQVRVLNDTNTAAGRLKFEMGWYTVADTGFNVVTAADNLNWGEWYRLDFDIRLCDGLNGTGPNDSFRLSIFDSNNNLVGSALGSTWETAWKTGNFGGGTTPRAVNGFDFWTRTGPNNALVGYIDNFSQTVMNIANPCLAPTAASVTVSGRVFSAKGRGISRARVAITGLNGESRFALTNNFGFYRFEDVTAGQTYTFTAFSKSANFAPQIVNITNETSEVNFSGRK